MPEERRLRGVVLASGRLFPSRRSSHVAAGPLGALTVLSIFELMPAQAQQAMSEPAYCAFFYPAANCQNKGPGNPYTDPNYRRSSPSCLSHIVEARRFNNGKGGARPPFDLS